MGHNLSDPVEVRMQCCRMLILVVLFIVAANSSALALEEKIVNGVIRSR